MVGASAIVILNNAREMDGAGIALLLAVIAITALVIGFLEWRSRRRSRTVITTAVGHDLQIGDWISIPVLDVSKPAEKAEAEIIEVTATTITLGPRRKAK